MATERSRQVALGVLLGVPAASAQRVSPSTEVAYGMAVLKGSSTYPRVRGDALVFRSGSGDRSITVDIWHASKLSGQRLKVYAAGHFIGRMLVTSRGRGHLHRDTAKGQYVPRLRVSRGPQIKVRTRHGTLVASGGLAPYVPPPPPPA